MPHIIVEHSSNLSSERDMSELAILLRDVAVSTGIFPLSGVRVRIYPCETYMIADGDYSNAFLSVLLRIGSGRSDTQKRAAGEEIFGALCDYFSMELSSGFFMLSLDIQENDSSLSFKRNSVRDRLES